MTFAIDIADVPPVAADELYRPMQHLIASGRGLALLRGLGEDDLRQLEDVLWQSFDGPAERRVAIALRFRALVAVFAGRRLKETLLNSGFRGLSAAIAEAASQRLNARFGFKEQHFVMALARPATAHTAPPAQPAYAAAPTSYALAA